IQKAVERRQQSVLFVRRHGCSLKGGEFIEITSRIVRVRTSIIRAPFRDRLVEQARPVCPYHELPARARSAPRHPVIGAVRLRRSFARAGCPCYVRDFSGTGSARSERAARHERLDGLDSHIRRAFLPPELKLTSHTLRSTSTQLTIDQPRLTTPAMPDKPSKISIIGAGS